MVENEEKYSENEIESQEALIEDIYDDGLVFDPIVIKSSRILISEEDFKKVFPRAKDGLVEALNIMMAKHDINTPERISHFLSQCGHESGEFRVFIENLNYSKDGLLAVFRKYFNEETATQYARKPSAIANRVYANRMGNGNEASGDGWKYRGRGLIQLTGHNNYKLFSTHINHTIEDTLAYCETPLGIVESAVWFWDRNNCNVLADQGDFRGLTRRINGGTNGLAHRKELLDKLLPIVKLAFSK